MNKTRPDPLAGKYTLECTHPGCTGEAIVSQDYAVGWQVGQLVGADLTNPAFARCHRCRRHKMRVKTAPPAAVPPGPKGFTKVPTT